MTHILTFTMIFLATASTLAVDPPKAVEEAEDEIISIVFLLKEPRAIDVDALREQAAKTFGKKFGATPVDENVVAKFREGRFGVMVGEVRMGLMAVDAPYIKEREKNAARYTDARLKKAIMEHKAFMALDLIGKVDDKGKANVYRHIGRLMADLAGDDVMAVFLYEHNKLVPYNAELVEKLRGENVLAAFQVDADNVIVNVEDDDPEMKAAIEKARKGFGQFRDAFNARKDQTVFAIKAPFREGEHVEHMWARVTAIEGEVIRGTLANQPGAMKNLKKGDAVEVKSSELTDWGYHVDGKPVGLFTEEVVRKRSRPEK